MQFKKEPTAKPKRKKIKQKNQLIGLFYHIYVQTSNLEAGESTNNRNRDS